MDENQIKFSMKKKNSAVSKHVIEEWSASLGIKRLPEDYIKFLLLCNGGYPESDTYSVKDVNGFNGSLISNFFGILADVDSGSLEKNFRKYSNRLPKDLMPIARDSHGNVLLLGVAGEVFNKVCVWIHDFDFDDTPAGSYESIFIVSDDFSAFLNSLEQSGLHSKEENQLRDICIAGDLKQLLELLENGMPVNEIDKNGHCLVGICAALGQIEMVRELLDRGADTAGLIYDAITGRQEKMAIYLFERLGGAGEVLPSGSTWLHLAAKQNLDKVVKYLIENGCPLNHQDRKGLSALSYVTDDPKKAEVELLIREAGGIELYY